MTQTGTSELPEPAGATTPAEFAGRLRALRLWAGAPSLRQLRRLGGVRTAASGTDRVDALPESTSSYVLRGDRPATAQFVRDFVAACLRARGIAPDRIAEQVERWHEAWLVAVGGAAGKSAATEPAPNPAAAALPVPRQLPADIADFTGRATELAVLVGLPEQSAAVATTVVITGPAGVGKTALAVHAAHRLAASFPDGQIFIDLQGFTPELAPVPAGKALDRLLRVLGVPGERVPADLPDRAALWRSVLAGRRMLMVLDNAADPDQVAPLLPGTAGSLVLVTSRRSLIGLPATATVPLEMLTVSAAVTLFTHTVAGIAGRLSEPAELVRRAVELCGRLPLAIRVAGARLRAHRAWRLADLVARLDGSGRLAELRGAAAAIEVSYQQLTAEQQLCYRRLGIHPGSQFEPYAVAALLGTGVARAGRLLEQLLDVHLLLEPAPERYMFHDLVRDHAVRVAARARQARSGRPRHAAALTRLADHYRHAASVAMDLADPHRRERRPRLPASRTPLPPMSTPEQASGWLDTELPNLVAVMQWAAAGRLPEHGWQLAVTIAPHLHTRGRFQDAEELNQRGLACARASGHRDGELAALLGVGLARISLSRYAAAYDDYHQALALSRAAEDRLAEADALAGLSRVYLQQSQYEQAIETLHRLLETAQAAGDRTGELNALRGLGFVAGVQGRYKQALDDYGRALQIARAAGNRLGESGLLASIGVIYRQMGQFDPAREAFAAALSAAEPMGAAEVQLKALVGLAHIDRMSGHLPRALVGYERAQQIAQAAGHRVAEAGATLGMGVVQLRQRRYDEAARRFRQVLDRAREAGDRNWEYEALQRLGRLHHATGDQPAAIAAHRRALTLATALDQPPDRVRAHDGLAHAYRALGRAAAAREHWQRALDLLTALGIEHTVEEAASARAILANLTGLGED